MIDNHHHPHHPHPHCHHLSQAHFSHLNVTSGKCLAITPDLSPHYWRRLEIYRWLDLLLSTKLTIEWRQPLVEILKLKNVAETLEQTIFYFRGQNPGSTAGEVRNVKSIILDGRKM